MLCVSGAIDAPPSGTADSVIALALLHHEAFELQVPTALGPFEATARNYSVRSAHADMYFRVHAGHAVAAGRPRSQP